MLFFLIMTTTQQHITGWKLYINLKSLSGVAKALGVALCLAGIMTIAFYTRPHLNPLNHYHPLGHKTSSTSHRPGHSKQNWMKGSFIMITATTTWSFGLVLQVRRNTSFFFLTWRGLITNHNKFALNALILKNQCF